MGRKRTGGGGTSVAVLGPASGVNPELPRALWTRGEDAVSAGLCDVPVSGAFAEDGTEQGLRGTSVMVRFVTNTTKESKRDLLERLKKLEFDISEDEIFTSLTAARNLVEQKQVRPMLLVDDRALPDFKGIQTSDPNAVVIGLAPEHFHYQTLNQAFRLLLDGAPLIAIHKARYYKRKDGLALGPGPFVTALEYATDTKATVVGKPEKTFFLEALRGTGCEPEEAVMIGDDCRDDVGGAQDVGMLGILVKTGKYRAADEEKISPPPYLTCESFPHAVDHILQHLL
ncbi:Haloacid dehalogenase-like hydrolase domain-containing protein 2 [Myotis brandtii]|uniref:Haloacid dehalogenase-like hydrolase domain-containing protein 2 n=2 Tax=Myotis brandtii TaxID=109478 RepID=S7MST6_MYOBR|nr:Haloacid dehalogenase-like hydrolase domain-containing protein 2 [Myotis brandtii]